MSARECGGQREEREVKLRRPRLVPCAWWGARAQRRRIFSVSQKLQTENFYQQPLYHQELFKGAEKSVCVNMKVYIKFPKWDYFPVLVLECDPWRAPPSATFMNTMGTSPPAISHRRLISGDHWAMMDEVGHAVIENTVSLAMSPVKQKTPREKE